MSEQRGGDRYLKRLYGHLCCKIWVGDPGWMSIHPEIGNLLVILLVILLALGGCDAVKGDLIVEVQEYGVTINPDTGWYTAEIGQNLSGFGRPLGWISFAQIAEGGGLAFISTGSFSDRYGTEDGEQQIQVQTTYTRGWDQAVLLPYGTPVGAGDTYSDFLRVYDSLTDLPANNPIYIPFLWRSWVGRTPTGLFDRVYQGVGYISIDEVDPMPIEGSGAHPDYRLDRIVLTNGDLYAGQIPQTNSVPEPGVLVAIFVVAAVLITQKWLTSRLSRSRMLRSKPAN